MSRLPSQNPPRLRLYHYWRSSCSWRVRWALDEKSVPAELRHVSLLDGESESSEHLERHSLGYVPVLERLDLSGPQRFLWDSTAMVTWIDDLVPQKPLFPKDSWSRAQVLALSAIITSDTQPIQNLNVLQRHSDDPEKQKSWAQDFIHRGLTAFERATRHVSKRFCFGDHLTWADLCLAPQCYNAERYGVPLNSYPTIQRLSSEYSHLESFLSSHPSRHEPPQS